MDRTEFAAIVSHEANRVYCQLNGDSSQPTWEDAPDWQKTSARLGVHNVLRRPNLTPADSHASWLAHKHSEGWKYGPVKDPVLKTHPCMVSYAELPEHQRKKDVIFIDAVRTAVRVYDDAAQSQLDHAVVLRGIITGVRIFAPAPRDSVNG